MKIQLFGDYVLTTAYAGKVDSRQIKNVTL
jgi:hypothetical protein